MKNKFLKLLTLIFCLLQSSNIIAEELDIKANQVNLNKDNRIIQAEGSVQITDIKKNVIFKGWIKNPKNFYLNSKVLLFPSLYDGLPNTLIDAINYNLPCISSRCSGAEDILTKKFGLFIPHDDPKFLAKKIEFVIKNYKNVNLNVLKIKKN